MEGSATVTRLWDFGWIQHDVVELGTARTAADLLEHYCASPAFHLSFLPSEKNESGLHGPFKADLISPSDFLPLSTTEIPEYIGSIEIAHDPTHDVEARAVILREMQAVLESNSDCFVLRFTEKNPEQFHDWGFVFSVFREILIPDLDKHRLDRFAIGYD